MQLGRFMGSLHPVLIHFPIVLLITAVALEGVAFVRKDARMSWAGKMLLLLGVVATLWTFVCGNFAEVWAAREGISQDAMEFHELLATITSWLFVGLAAWRMLMRDGEPGTPRVWRGAWLAAATAAAVLLGFTGHYGGQLVFEHAAAVQNVALQRIPTHEDLFTLTQRQSQDSIFYSDMMHHIFGWMVLLLSLMLLLDVVAPKAAARARRLGPLLLLAGGAFLMVFSDQDAWPLYHIHPFRPITDKEVLLHKTYAVLMLLIGLRGLWVMRRARRAEPNPPAPFPHSLASLPGKGEPVDGGSSVPPSLAERGTSEAARGRGEGQGVRSEFSQSRLMAVFALVGGALLFTHVHSAAPYANVAVGVYIHHTALGVVALLIGAVKLLEDARPSPKLARRLAYPALMLLEAALLLNYNEGLPWFLGYRDFSTVAAHGGLVAPLGPDRAELAFDPATARLQMFVERPNDAQPVRLPTQSATAIVRVGEEATEVPLRANPGGETTSAHFAATVPFLRGVPLFTTQAHVKVGGRAYTADFEPWVDPTQARHSAQPWVCPMHPWVGSSQPGVCPVAGCGMRLEPNRPPRPAGVLHDPDYRMDLATDPPAPDAGQPTRLTLTLRSTRDGATVRDLDTVHTKKMHLIVASRDLSFFDHIHPVQQPDGRFVIAYTFPHGGAFSLYADVTPTGAPNQVFHIPVNVSGARPPDRPLRETPAPARLFGDYRVTLSPSPWPLVARDEATLTFSIEKDGLPVTDLEPYLGAGGHCVGLSADGADYLHSHPLQTPGAATTGPDVTFHARVPRPGLYKVWGQFQHHGRILVADFVVRVN